MTELVVVTGPPGAGKSAVAALLASRFERAALVAGDSFFGFLGPGAVEPWLPEAQEQNTAVIEAAAAAAGRLAGYCDVVFEGVLGPWFLSTFLRASGLGHLHFAVLSPPLDVCLDRVRSRAGHGFTDLDAAAHMWRDFDSYPAQHRHFDDGASPAEMVQLIGQATADGSIRYPPAFS